MTRPHEDPACRCVACREHDFIGHAAAEIDGMMLQVERDILLTMFRTGPDDSRLARLEEMVNLDLLTVEDAVDLLDLDGHRVRR